MSKLIFVHVDVCLSFQITNECCWRCIDL